MADINYYLTPPRYKRFKSELRDKAFKLLDVGCTNGSSLLAKHWFPKCTYHGLDLPGAQLSETERKTIDRFFPCNLETADLSAVPDESYDVIVFAHVIEHLSNGLDVLGLLTRKLAAGGRIYVEFPSVNSLSLPSASNTLNFSDDPTHIRVYDIKDISNTLMSKGLRVLRAGRRREWARIALSPLTLPKQIKSLATSGKLDANGLWDLLGFADYVYARRPAATSK